MIADPLLDTVGNKQHKRDGDQRAQAGDFFLGKPGDPFRPRADENREGNARQQDQQSNQPFQSQGDAAQTIIQAEDEPDDTQDQPQIPPGDLGPEKPQSRCRRQGRSGPRRAARFLFKSRYLSMKFPFRMIR